MALDGDPVSAGGRRCVQRYSSCERDVHPPAGLLTNSAKNLPSYPSHGRALKT